jgi:hypothetical protein
MKLDETTTTRPRSNMHTQKRFYDHFMVIKTLRGYYRGHNPGMSEGID